MTVVTRCILRMVFATALLVPTSLLPTTVRADGISGVQPLHREFSAALASLPAQSHQLLESESIERFLTALDGHSPDWATVYGQGHHDPGHDERLFSLNRERDANRTGKDALQWVVAFAWLGELSRFDEEEGGFRVALGPKFTRTTWGEVRFKHEDLPATLIALAGDETAHLRTRLQQGERIDIEVLMAGRLIEGESLVYDFSHEVEGQGIVMPVVRVDALAFVLRENPPSRP
ncbi:MAG: hypothetical protein KF806_10675 [Nitrospira sp.]|nr:hypothetical protein [Nitrospira sp.]MDR4471942.1 hypothetical protein [Nitrospira sp.]